MDVAKRVAPAAGFILIAVLAWAALAVFTPETPTVPADFYTLYSSVVAASRGISPYDHAAVAQIQQAELGWDAVERAIPSLPYFYPPWYALVALPLAMLPVRTAALAWLVINCLAVMVSSLLAFKALGWRTGRWSVPLLVGATLFAPTLLDLVVGQYGMPVLLGVCLVGAFCADAPAPADGDAGGPVIGRGDSGRWRAVAAGVGLILLTFKPQLGIVALLVAGVWLVQRRLWQPLLWALGLLLVLGALSFRISPRWPVEMIAATATYTSWAGVPFPIGSCDNCSTFAGIVESAGIVGPTAVLLDVAVAAGLVVVLAAAWRRRGQDLAYLLSFACVATVLGSPYLRVYDLVILVLPFLFLLHSTVGATQHSTPNCTLFTRVVLFIVYVLPLVGTLAGDRLFVGRSGVLMAVALLVLLLRQARSEEVPG